MTKRFCQVHSLRCARSCKMSFKKKEELVYKDLKNSYLLLTFSKDPPYHARAAPRTHFGQAIWR